MPTQSPEHDIAPVPEQGQLVVVRQRTYTVTDISQSSIATGVTSPVQPSGQHLVMLSSIEDDALGEELQVVWELEPGTSVLAVKRHLGERSCIFRPTGSHLLTVI
jgi:hypothetical protein